MIFSDTGAGLSTLVIALLYVSQRLEVWQVILVTAAISAFSTFQWPAYSAATTMLVPKAQLGRASGMVAHEMGHAYGLSHVNCGSPAGPYAAEALGGPALPLMTDEPGIDWATRAFQPTGTNEVMSYCTPDWTSTAHWNVVFAAMPI